MHKPKKPHAEMVRGFLADISGSHWIQTTESEPCRTAVQSEDDQAFHEQIMPTHTSFNQICVFMYPNCKMLKVLQFLRPNCAPVYYRSRGEEDCKGCFTSKGMHLMCFLVFEVSNIECKKGFFCLQGNSTGHLCC